MSLVPGQWTPIRHRSVTFAPPSLYHGRKGVLQQLRALCLETDSFSFFPVTGKKKKRKDAFVRVCYTFFFCCYAATQPARQVRQEHTQVVCSNKIARKRLARRNSRNGPWTHECCFEVDVLVCWEWIEEFEWLL